MRYTLCIGPSPPIVIASKLAHNSRARPIGQRMRLPHGGTRPEYIIHAQPVHLGFLAAQRDEAIAVAIQLDVVALRVGLA